jgi:hypothetical protein
VIVVFGVVTSVVYETKFVVKSISSENELIFDNVDNLVLEEVFEKGVARDVIVVGSL